MARNVPGKGAAQLDQLFNELFVDDDGKPAQPEDALGPAQLVVLAERLNINPDDQIMYAIAWRLNCQTPCAVTRDEWKQGLAAIGIDNLQRLKESLPAIQRDLHANRDRFRSFYNFVFEWSRETPSVRYISAEMALALWPMVFKGQEFKWMKEWLDFVGNHTGDKPVKRDVWKLAFDFSKEDLAKYSADAAWPSVMDDFVKWMQDQKKI
jgi:DCN1-like protein 1/2